MNNYSVNQLKNGLRLIFVPLASTEVITIMAMFGVGSRYESEEQAGISHVLEHMFFKGTKKRPTAIQMAEFVDSLGAVNNAFTSKEVTGYYVKLRPKNLEAGFDYLSDLLLGALFDKSELEREKNVILQEINMYEDLPMEMVENYFEKVTFGNNALGREVIGYRDTVQKVTRESLLDYHNEYYQGENAVLVLAGNFGERTKEDIASLAEKYFTFGDLAIGTPTELEKPKKDKYFIQGKKTEQSHIVIGFETVPIDHPDYFKLELIATILGGSMSSRMFEQIRERRGLAYSVRTLTSNYKESGNLFTQAGVEHNKVNEAIVAILDEYKKIGEIEVSQSELQKAREVITGKMMIRMEDSEELAHHYATEALLSKKIMTPEEIAQVYAKINASDILETSKRYFTNERLALSFIGPELNQKELDQILKI